jgi:hypothetical protein
LLAGSGSEASDKPASEVVLAERGKSDFTIVLGADAGETARFAAEELQRYLKEISGALLPIVTQAAAGQKTIALREAARSSGRFALPQIEEPFDGYRVSLGSKGAEIVGQSPRGILYGVYELLERLGCRWFYPRHDAKDPEIIPQRPRLTLAPFEYEVASPPAIRTFMIRGIPPDAEEMALRDVDWAAKARYNAIEHVRLWLDENGNLRKSAPDGKVGDLLRAIRRRGLLSFGIGHAFRLFLPTETYLESHPEWFGLKGGKRVPHRGGGAQFCWSNPDAVHTFVDNVVAWLKAGPAVNVLKIGAEDGLPACECERCKSLNPADWYQQIANQITARAAELNPKLMVMTPVGYPPLRLPPKSTKPHPRLHAMYEHWGRDQSISFDDPRYPAADVDRWQAATDGRLSVLLYYGGLMTSPPVPPPYTKTFTGDRAFMLRRTPEGFFALQFPKRTWWTTGFNNYLMGRAGYDVRLDPGAVLEDYCRAYYGPAAAPMLRYYRELAGDVAFSYRVARSTRGTRPTASVRDADRDRLRALARVLEEARKAAGQAPYDYRVSKAVAVHDYLDTLRQSRDHRAAVMSAVEARTTGAPAPSREDLDKIIAAEEALLAGDRKRLETMPPGTYDPLLARITGRAGVGALKRAVAGQKAGLKEPGERTAEEGAQLIDQLRAR